MGPAALAARREPSNIPPARVILVAHHSDFDSGAHWVCVLANAKAARTCGFATFLLRVAVRGNPALSVAQFHGDFPVCFPRCEVPQKLFLPRGHIGNVELCHLAYSQVSVAGDDEMVAQAISKSPKASFN